MSISVKTKCIRPTNLDGSSPAVLLSGAEPSLSSIAAQRGPFLRRMPPTAPMKSAGLAPRRRSFEAFPAMAQAARRSAELQAQDLTGRAYERHHEAAGERPYHRVREALQHHGGQSFRSVSGFSSGTVELRSMSGGGRTVARRSSANVAPRSQTEQMQQ